MASPPQPASNGFAGIDDLTEVQAVGSQLEDLLECWLVSADGRKHPNGPDGMIGGC